MSGFDRIKPPDKRLLAREETSQPDSGQADPLGRAALFSASTEPTTPGAGAPSPHVDPAAPVSEKDPRLPQGTSPLHVECGHCRITCPLPLSQAVRNAIPMTLVAPWRSHPVFATCPCGLHRAWLKPKFGLPR